MPELLSPALVVGAHTVGLAVTRALSRVGVPVVLLYYDPQDMGVVSRHAAEVVAVPHPEQQEEAFVQALRRLAPRYNGSFLVPASDASLTAIARRKTELARDYQVACVDWGIAELFIDKKHTYALAEAAGVPIPRTQVPNSMDEAEAYGRSAQYPCLVKPCRGHHYFDALHRKMSSVQNLDELMRAYRQAAALGLEVMLQEIIPGEAECGVNYNSYRWDGRPLVEFTAHKVRNAPPDFGSPCVAQNEPMPEVVQPGRAILDALGFYGYSCTEFKRDPRDGIYKLMEVNGRHNLSSLLAVNCGINFPALHYRHLMLGELPEPQSNLSPEMPAARRRLYWIDLSRDLAYHAPRVLRRQYSLRALLKPYLQPHVFAILDWHDLRPFLKRLLDQMRDALRRPAQPAAPRPEHLPDRR